MHAAGQFEAAVLKGFETDTCSQDRTPTCCSACSLAWDSRGGSPPPFHQLLVAMIQLTEQQLTCCSACSSAWDWASRVGSPPLLQQMLVAAHGSLGVGLGVAGRVAAAGTAEGSEHTNVAGQTVS